MEERIQKILARVGYGSRRSCEELIVARRVKVNGIVAALGSKADQQKDDIRVDEQPIAKGEEQIYIALHKPRGVLSDVDPKNDTRQTVRDLVPVPGHLFAVGRLDFDSEGLILLTNDGELANKLTHPRYGHEKEYRVLVATHPDAMQLDTWRRGVVLEDGYKTAPARVIVDGDFGKGTWMRVILREGRKRQIREVGARIGLPVVRIIRIRIGNLVLGALKPREWRHLTADEVNSLRGPEQPGERKPRRPVQTVRRAPAERPAGVTHRPRSAPRATGANRSNERPPRDSERPSGGRPPRRPLRGPKSN